MSLSVRTNSLENKLKPHFTQSKSFFSPFQKDEVSENVLVLDKSGRLSSQDPTIGSSLKIDGNDVINFSMGAHGLFLLTNDHMTDNLIADELGSNLSKIEALLNDKIFQQLSSRSRYIDVVSMSDSDDLSKKKDLAVSPVGINYNGNDGRIDEIENKILDLSQVILYIDNLLDLLEKSSGQVRSHSTLKGCMKLTAQYVCDSSETVLFSTLRQCKKEIQKSRCSFVEGKGNCILPTVSLQQLKYIPRQLLRSVFFEVEGDLLTLHKMKELKVKYSFMLVYHMLMIQLRQLFEICLQNECEDKHVLYCLEGFIWNAIEMDTSDLIIRLESTFWKWNNQAKWLDYYEVQIWCINLIKKMESYIILESSTCADEDEAMNLKDKFNLAKLFLDEFNDILFSTRSIEPLGLQENEYEDILTRFANSLETRVNDATNDNICNIDRVYANHQFTEHFLSYENSLRTVDMTVVVDPQEKTEPSVHCSAQEIIECDSSPYEGSVYFQQRNVKWREYVTSLPRDSLRYRLWHRLQKIKEGYFHWSSKRSLDKTMRLFETAVANQIKEGLRFHEGYQNTTYGDIEPRERNFSRLREKKRRLMFRFFGEE